MKQIILKLLLLFITVKGDNNFYDMYLSSWVPDIQKSSNCVTYCGNKIQNLDGLLLDAPLYCANVLFETNKLKIIVRACSIKESKCSYSLVVMLNDIEYTFEKFDTNFIVKTPKLQFPIPSNQALDFTGMKVTKIRSNIQIELLDYNVVVVWDTNKLVKITVPPSLRGKTKGLCGNMDGDKNNDLISPEGIKQKTVELFVESWKSPKHNIGDCIEGPTDIFKCSSEEKRKKGESLCTQIYQNQKLSKCMTIFNVKELIKSCISDYCGCTDFDPSSCICESGESFANECSSKNIILDQGWRDLNICPFTCPQGKIYNHCGPINELKCGDIEKLTQKCMEGCYCQEGSLVDNFGKCVKKQDCNCEKDGRIFKPNSEYIVDCNNCICKNGLWDCEKKNCSSDCTIHGDPHYKTFDGTKYDFMGKCSYYLLYTKNLTIVGENVPCPVDPKDMEKAKNMVSCTKSVTVSYMVDNQWRLIKLKYNKIVEVDGNVVNNFPITLDDIVTVKKTSSNVILDFVDGLHIEWDAINGMANTVRIRAPFSYYKKTMGMCGTFNGDKSDDFTLPNGRITNSVPGFGQKWQTDDYCLYKDLPPTADHPCKKDPIVKEKADKLCSKLKGDIFKSCHTKVNPEESYQDCMFDMCASMAEDIDFFCAIMSTHACDCSQQGIVVEWRKSVSECNPDLCPKDQFFDSCADSCKLSCKDYHQKNCKSNCIATCRCPDGQAIYNNKCVPISKCPCEGTVDGKNSHDVQPGCIELRNEKSTITQICTCKGALWDCKFANDKELELQPPNTGNCSIKCNDNQKLQKCLQLPTVTCDNYFNYHPIDISICIPGCSCKENLVLDISTNECVKPQDCKCKEGDVRKEKCNNCVCKNGYWTCSKKSCNGICSLWGNSHINTFDDKDFDFKGLCSYILTQGTLNEGKSNEKSFSVILNNQKCGSLGETCLNSLNIKINVGDETEDLTLSPNLDIPEPYFQYIKLYKYGSFLVIELDIGIKILWDKESNVQIISNENWENKLEGLCGNFNYNPDDDFTTSTLRIEKEVNKFVDSWKTQCCCKTVPPINSCEQHLHRKSWAEKQCQILKNSLFESCHKIINVNPYFNKCVNDVCACNQGGDSKCLCSAISGYAQACSVKGFPIKWRNGNVCPMQCNSNEYYDPCVKLCPGECDLCQHDFCVEGCQKLCNNEDKNCISHNDWNDVCSTIKKTSEIQNIALNMCNIV